MSSAKAALLAAARRGGSAAVREAIASGISGESIVVRCAIPAVLQYRLTDQNYHSVQVHPITDGLVRLSAPVGYGLEDVARNLSLPIVIP